MRANFSDTVRHKGEQLAKAQRINKFLEDVCWIEDILPELTGVRAKYDKLLVSRALGEYRSSVDIKVVPTVEELAGRVAGIDFVIEFFEDCISAGDSAAEWLNNERQG